MAAVGQSLRRKRAVVAWVQKVSNLILNINVRISDVETGKALKSGSVDIRGNSDQSWERGLKFLLEEHCSATGRSWLRMAMRQRRRPATRPEPVAIEMISTCGVS